jgi:hypothetical protein
LKTAPAEEEVWGLSFVGYGFLDIPFRRGIRFESNFRKSQRNGVFQALQNQNDRDQALRGLEQDFS